MYLLNFGKSVEMKIILLCLFSTQNYMTLIVAIVFMRFFL